MSKQDACSQVGSQCCCRHASTVLIAVVGIAVSAAVFYAAYSWEQDSTGREFASLSEDRFHAIENKNEDGANLLRFADNAILVRPKADSPEFPKYLRSLAAVLKTDIVQHPAVQAVTWMPRVSPEEQSAYEKAASEAFAAKFQFKEANNSAGAAGAKPEEFFPYYLRISGNSDDVLAGDAAANSPADRKAMDQARDSGHITAGAPLQLAGESHDRLGYRLFQPLYNGEAKDVAARRQNIAGFLCVDLDMGEAVAMALKGIPPVGIDAWVYDDSDAEKIVVCRHASRLNSPDNVAEEDIARDELEFSATTDFFGRKLLVRCFSTPAFWTGRTVWQPWVLLCGGLILTLTVVGYRISLAVRADAVERTVSARMAAFCQDAEKRAKG